MEYGLLLGNRGWGMVVEQTHSIVGSLFGSDRKQGKNFLRRWMDSCYNCGFKAILEKFMDIRESIRNFEASRRIDREQLLDRYAAGERNFRAILLKEVDLTGVNLRGIDFYQATIENTIFADADLREANLGEVYTVGLDLHGANLSSASLFEATLNNADLSNANLSNAQLAFADLNGANLSGANLRNVRMIDTSLSEANLRNADLSNSKIEFTRLDYADLRDAILDNVTIADMEDVNWEYVSRTNRFTS